MAGERKARDNDLPYQPGVVTNVPPRDAIGRFKDSNRIRWFKGLPEKIGGWVRQTLGGKVTYIGIARALHDWTSLDTQKWVAIGTNCKLYLVNNEVLYDVTPMRKASNTVDSLSVTLGSPIITVHDPDHRANEGDHITLIASAAIGGFEVNGSYDIDEVIDPDTYTVTFSQNFSSTATGGGFVTVEYDVSCGLPYNGELLGYGTGVYSAGTYGTPRAVGTGVPARMRTWSLDNWGEDLVGAYSDGELYWWDRTNGPNSRAQLVSAAPTGIQRMLVNPENRHIILLGCSGLDGIFDPMRVRWCSQEDLNTWIPTQENTAGGKRLDYGSRLVTGIRSRTQNLIWTDSQLYAMQYVGAPYVFGFNPLGACKIVGPNAAIDVNGTVYFMVFNDFMVYDGTLRVLPCEVHTRVFGDADRAIEGDFDETQAEGVYCSSYMAKNEVTWFYPTRTGGIRYVTLNYSADNPCWYFGEMTRTAYRDGQEILPGKRTNPYGVNNGYLYLHETGKNEVEGATITPQDWWLETYDNHAGGSDAVVLMHRMVPNFSRITGEMRMRLYLKAYPMESAYRERGPFTVSAATPTIDARAKAAQLAIRWESAGGLDEDFRMGMWQINGTPYGGRMGVTSTVFFLTPPVLYLQGAPILLASLQEDVDGSFAALTWSSAVAGQFPIDFYEIERSTDGGAFETIGIYAADNPSPYEYSDITITQGHVYTYRVHAVNTDDSEGPLSDTAEVEWPAPAVLLTNRAIYVAGGVGSGAQQPAFNISFADGDIQISIEGPDDITKALRVDSTDVPWGTSWSAQTDLSPPEWLTSGDAADYLISVFDTGGEDLNCSVDFANGVDATPRAPADAGVSFQVFRASSDGLYLHEWLVEVFEVSSGNQVASATYTVQVAGSLE